jgi:exonuclease III
MLFPGVVTYVKDKLLPLDARADWLVTQDDDSDDEASTADLCKEGRIMYTDHGSFVLLNVYVPNAGGQIGQPRMDFKLRYLKALQKTCDALVRSGRHVVVVGDFNVAHRDIDVHSRWKIAEIYTVGVQLAISAV